MSFIFLIFPIFYPLACIFKPEFLFSKFPDARVYVSLSVAPSLDWLPVCCLSYQSLPLQLSCLSIDPSLQSMASRVTQSDQLGPSANTICMEIHLPRAAWSRREGRRCQTLHQQALILPFFQSNNNGLDLYRLLHTFKF